MKPRILVLAMALAIAPFTMVLAPANAATVSGHPWISFEAAVNNLYQADAPAAQWGWNNTSSLVTCDGAVSPCTPDGLAAPSADRFTSEATFAADVGSIPSSIKYVVYDIEDGNGTPTGESQQAATYMKDFNQIAVTHGLIPVITPALDNGNDAVWCPKNSGETNWQWSIRCNLWGHSVAGSQGLGNSVIQGQTLTTDLANYDTLWSQGSQEILNWFGSPKAKPWDEISTNYGTASQEEAAAQSIPSTTGLYYSFTSSGVSTADTVMKDLQAAGW